MQDKVMINGIDVTAKRIKWDFEGDWDTSIDMLGAEFSSSLRDLITVEVGMEIRVTRGFTTSTDEKVFIGDITQVKPQVNKIVLVCKNRLIDAVKSAQTKSWDKDIDLAAGVGSEIFKDICDNSGLSYSASSIESTGTSEILKITKFIQSEEDDFQKMNELASLYKFIISYDYEAEEVTFKSKGYSVYPVSLTVGTDIPGQIKWKQNMEQLINKVKVNGATVYDRVVQTFTGPATTFTLSKTPEDTEVRINFSTTNDLQTRGQKDLGVLGSDFDYYIDAEQKTITFSEDVSDVWINYGAQIPLPVVLSDTTSINLYGGPNKIPHYKIFFFNDIKSIKDAESRGQSILDKYAYHFTEAVNIPVVDEIIQTNGSFKPGYVVPVIDTYNDVNESFFVTSVKKSWPHVHDKITIGNEVWKTEDWQADQMKKVNQIFNTLQKNSDVVTTAIGVTRDIKPERRYMLGQKIDRSSDGVDTFILDHPVFGVLGTQKLGDAGTSATDFILLQGNNTYKEFCYDEVFNDTGSTTATFDTTNKEITFTSGQVWYSEAITLGVTWDKVTVDLASSTGTLTIEVSADNKSNWQTVTDGVEATLTNSDATGFYIRVTESGASTASVSTTFTASEDYDEPAIKITFTE